MHETARPGARQRDGIEKWPIQVHSPVARPAVMDHTRGWIQMNKSERNPLPLGIGSSEVWYR